MGVRRCQRPRDERELRLRALEAHRTTPGFSMPVYLSLLALFYVALGIAGWLSYSAHGSVLAIVPWVAAAVGPLGALMRFQLHTSINRVRILQGFPIGTLAANFLACVIASAFPADFKQLSPVAVVTVAVVRCGFASALSTVSSFAGELVTMDRLPACVYAAATIIIPTAFGLGVMLLTESWW